MAAGKTERTKRKDLKVMLLRGLLQPRTKNMKSNLNFKGEWFDFSKDSSILSLIDKYLKDVNFKYQFRMCKVILSSDFIHHLTATLPQRTH